MRTRIALVAALAAASITIIILPTAAGAAWRSGPPASAGAASATAWPGRHQRAETGGSTAHHGRAVLAGSAQDTTLPPGPPVPWPPLTSPDRVTTDTANWECIRIHESGDRYNSPDAPSGAYGIIQVTWHAYGYSGWPYQAPASVQDDLALRLYNQYGWAPWGSRGACGL